jgi:CRISPR-associated protein Csx14
METCTSSLCVKVDAANPGHFFACCGLLELAHRIWRGAEGWFENGQFCVAAIATAGRRISDVLRELVQCEARVDASGEGKESDNKTSPILLGQPINLELNWWLSADGKPNLFKTWAANATSRQMYEKWREALRSVMSGTEQEPGKVLYITAPVQGSYGFDSSLSWDSLRAGFSLNEHAQYKKLAAHPAVELLGALGLQRFFPQLDKQEQTVIYGTWSVPLSPSVAPLAATGTLRAGVATVLRSRFVYRGSFKGLNRATPI